jgi:hypothetical protein
VERRLWIFALVGASLVGTVALLVGLLSLDPGGCSGAAAYVDVSFCPPRIEILRFQLSAMEVAAWALAVGLLLGAPLGFVLDRATRRSVQG